MNPSDLIQKQNLVQEDLFEIIEFKIKEFLLNYTSKYNVFNGKICRKDEANEILSLNSEQLMRVAYEIGQRNKTQNELNSYAYKYVECVCYMIRSLHSVKDRHIISALGYYFEGVKCIGNAYTKGLSEIRLLNEFILS